MVSKLGNVVLIINTSFGGYKNTPPKSFRGHQQRAKDYPRTFPRPFSAARSKQTKPKRVPRATKMLRDQTMSKILEALGPLGSPHETPREPQELPKWSRESPQTRPKPSLDRKRWIFKNVIILIRKPTCVRVGESVWELKIHPKRFREEIEVDIENRRKKKTKK